MEFEWDEEKNEANARRHGVTFEEAASVFGDPLSDTYDDPDHSAQEYRFLTIGISENGRLLIVAHTDRGDRIRIISARELTGRERKKYEEENQ
ncbi:MAG: BrnT family toxin [Acidobacteriota bacterium]